ncbi:MAG TPA: hypothetical protein ENN55_05945 [Firmicutes bacterium]|nr:hypothetical protein [Bacillota bacterium]
MRAKPGRAGACLFRTKNKKEGEKMRIGVTLEDEKGIDSEVSPHFGQCSHFLIVDMEENGQMEKKVVKNNAVHGGGGCLAVDEMLSHGVNRVIAGGMGVNAQKKFADAGVKIYGFSGNVKKALDAFVKKELGGLEGCKEHEGC